MVKSERYYLNKIGKSEVFKEIIRKLSLREPLGEDEKVYILSCAILLLNGYENDGRRTTYTEFAYYIILEYSLTYNDYIPLYDFSINFGFYPITNSLLQEGFIDKNIEDVLIDIRLQRFKKDGGYMETLEQSKESKSFLSDNSKEKSYIAPTSFGKSALIIDYIKNIDANSKIAIIVPSKSLLVQTYNSVRKEKIQKKILIHNEMYDNEDAFIAIFTQERALRLLNKRELYFDAIIIDEAHNILKNDGRSILLTRLISLNYARNSNQNVVYLSPLINKIDNIKIRKTQEITEHIVNFNIKEPKLYEYTTQGKVYHFNRFINEFYEIENDADFSDKYKYIQANSGEKNFLYITSPKKIEEFVKEIKKHFNLIEQTLEIKELKEILKREVHEDFYIIDALDYGAIYLHGKLPDIIKEYLEYKFREIPEIKYIIANTVILEGINLPIDTLYICDFYKLHGKELINLIGRVNRLNEIFTPNGSYLEKLFPKVHLINTKEYKNHNTKFKELESRVFIDEVRNPLLYEYDIEENLKNIDDDHKKDKKEKIITIQRNEDFITQTGLSHKDIVKQYFIKNGLNEYYNNLDLTVSHFIRLQAISSTLNTSDVIDKINLFFINNIIDNINDYELRRLNEEPARNYYKNYISINLRLALKDNINSQYEFLINKSKQENPYLYFGESYGRYAYNKDEKKYWIPSKSSYGNAVYVNLLEKDKKELINLSIVKIKLEENFISYTLSKFVETLYDFNLITEDEYNLYTYGTTDQEKIFLTKTGLNISLISRLDESGQLKNIKPDKYNNITGNDEFKEFLKGIDDFYRFEINRFIQ